MAASEAAIRRFLAQEHGLDEAAVTAVRVLRRSIDARQRQVMVQLTVRVYEGEEPQDEPFRRTTYPDVSRRPQVVVVGAGPGGLFAALRLVELGLRPIVLERGKDVHERKRDLAAITRRQAVDAESNYCFGEGGAGAYSDGKLYTRSKKRGNTEKILHVFCQHGAPTAILADAHPHIGTDRLPQVIEAMRQTILRSGGEVHFQTRMTGLVVRGGRVVGCLAEQTLPAAAEAAGAALSPAPSAAGAAPSAPSAAPSAAGAPSAAPSAAPGSAGASSAAPSGALSAAPSLVGQRCALAPAAPAAPAAAASSAPAAAAASSAASSSPAPSRRQLEFSGPVILATGHSARDVYAYLHRSGLRLEAKGLAVGVRLEHPARLIDQIQYHSPEGRGRWLPAAEYAFVTQASGRGVYSFCMCPGGFVIPAATGPEQLVVNGMSPASRGTRWSNSGMVVELRPEDVPGDDPLRLMRYQEQLERLCWQQAGQRQTAPAQRMADFVAGRQSQDLPPSSYQPGLTPSPLSQWLPRPVRSRLQEGFSTFGRQARGFLTNEAVLIGVETRTSSPLRIVRLPDTLQHPDVPGLFPCGEGAGYAGGIVSAAVDGERCAEQCAQYMQGA